MDQVLGILIVALLISIVIGAIASGAQRLLGFGIIAAIATALIGMVTGSSFSLPNVVGAIQPNSGLPERIETINPAAGSTTAAPSNSFGEGEIGSAAGSGATGSEPGSAASSAGAAAGTATGSVGGAGAAGAGANNSAGANNGAGTSPQPVNALW